MRTTLLDVSISTVFGRKHSLRPAFCLRQIAVVFRGIYVGDSKLYNIYCYGKDSNYFLVLIRKTNILTNVLAKDCNTEKTTSGDNSLISNFYSRALYLCM